jgi:hypothetical protein
LWTLPIRSPSQRRSASIRSSGGARRPRPEGYGGISRFPHKERPYMPGSLTAPSGQALAITRRSVLPCGLRTPSALGMSNFRGSMAGLYDPLPTPRLRPHGQNRTARGRCGLLLLHRSGLSPPTPCRSPAAREAPPIISSPACPR